MRHFKSMRHLVKQAENLLGLCYLKYFRIALRKNEWGFILPHGIGDACFVCGFAGSFLEKHGPGLGVAIVKKSQKEIPKLYSSSIHRIVVLKESEIRRMVQYIGSGKRGRLFIAHPLFHCNSNFLESHLGREGWTLLDIYRKFLDIPQNQSLVKPTINQSQKNRVEATFRRAKLIAGKTVILLTEAVSIKMPIPITFWELVAHKLKEKGYCVATNIVENTKTIAGTTPLSVPLDQVISMAELAGWIIAVRSGLCDLISFSQSNKLSVLYPKHKWYAGTCLTGASLKTMGLSNDVYEYEVGEETDWETMATRVTSE